MQHTLKKDFAKGREDGSQASERGVVGVGHIRGAKSICPVVMSLVFSWLFTIHARSKIFIRDSSLAIE